MQKSVTDSVPKSSLLTASMAHSELVTQPKQSVPQVSCHIQDKLSTSGKYNILPTLLALGPTTPSLVPQSNGIFLQSAHCVLLCAEGFSFNYFCTVQFHSLFQTRPSHPSSSVILPQILPPDSQYPFSDVLTDPTLYPHTNTFTL